MDKRYLGWSLAALMGVLGWKNRNLLLPTPKVDSNKQVKPFIISHRGIGNGYPESTLPAFESAAIAGAGGLELDVHLTKDSQLVVLHDANISTTTNGKGAVRDLTLAQLRQFAIRDRKGVIYPTLTIPTLEEVLQATKLNTRYYIELKGVAWQNDLVERTLSLLAEYDLLQSDKIVLQSFSAEKLLAVKKHCPHLPCMLLFRTYRVQQKKALTHPFEYTGLESRDVSPAFVDRLHQAGKQVYLFFIWQWLEKYEQQRLCGLPIDGYFTDDLTYTQKLFAHLPKRNH